MIIGEGFVKTKIVRLSTAKILNYLEVASLVRQI